MSKRIAMAIGATLAATLLMPGAAMAAPNFSGNWVRDPATANPASYPNYWVVRAPPPVPGGFNQSYVVQVQQAANSVQVTDPVHPQRTYLLDGKSHTMLADSQRVQATVSAKMEGDTMTVSTAQPYSGLPGSVQMTTKETWSISRDGQVLTILTERISPAQRQMFVEVFNRR